MSSVIDRLELTADAPAGADVGPVRVAPDGRRLAWARHDGPDAGIWVGEPGSRAPPVQIARADPFRAEDLAWSPDGERLAWSIGGGPPPGGARAVAWGSSRAPGEEGRVDGSTFAWTPKSGALVVADHGRRAILRHGIAPKRTVVELGPLDDDGDPHFPARIAVAPDGARFAFTCRRVADAVSEVWVVDRKDDRPSTTLLTQVPGAGVHVLPFWSTRSVTLGMLIVHVEQERTAIVLVPRLEGEGVVLYESAWIDHPAPPAWAPSGAAIAFLRTEAPAHEFTRSGPPSVALLATDDPAHALTTVTRPGDIQGQPRFLDDRTLVVDGGTRALLLRFDAPV